MIKTWKDQWVGKVHATVCNIIREKSEEGEVGQVVLHCVKASTEERQQNCEWEYDFMPQIVSAIEQDIKHCYDDNYDGHTSITTLQAERLEEEDRVLVLQHSRADLDMLLEGEPRGRNGGSRSESNFSMPQGTRALSPMIPAKCFPDNDEPAHLDHVVELFELALLLWFLIWLPDRLPAGTDFQLEETSS